MSTNMNIRKNQFIICVILFYFELVSGYLEYDSWISIELRHAIDPLNPEKFTFRGNVTIPSLNIGLANLVQEPLGTQEKENLLKLAENDQFYRLKAITSYSDGNQKTFLTSAKACALTNSQLNDVLWISMDSVGSVTGITESVSGIGDCNNNIMTKYDLESFNTDVLIKHMELAPIPDTNSFIQKMDREREARERGQVTDNRGFFAKYWMYIVPIALLVLISGATNPEAQAAGGR